MEKYHAPSLHNSLIDKHDSSSSLSSKPAATVSDSHPQEPGAGSTASAQLLPGDQPITAAESADALQQAENGVEVEGYEDDGYETTTDSAASTSLASSAREFIYENGRRYHSYRKGSYLFPNDDREQDREDLKHAMYLKLFNSNLHFAPINTEGANVIDLGTGTGIWAIDFADSYDNASVVGIDLSPIQTNWVPPNLKFMVDDAESEWVYPLDHFDFVHTRHTIQAFKNWPLLMERAFAHIKPGGWMECQEIDHFPRCEDGSMAPDDWMVKYWDTVADGLVPFGVCFRDAPKLRGMMEAAGFINITERVFFTPLGPWPKNRALKEVGLYWRAVLMEGLEAIALAPLIKGLGWQKAEVDVFCAKTRAAYLDRKIHAYMPFFILYGQKPYTPATMHP